MQEEAIRVMAKEFGVTTGLGLIEEASKEAVYNDCNDSYCTGCGSQGPNMDPFQTGGHCECCDEDKVEGLQSIIFALSSLPETELDEVIDG